MSPPKSTSPLETPAPVRSAGLHRKPRADLYTVLLVISLIAVLLGILFLYLYNARYDFKRKSSAAAAMVRDRGPGARGQRFERPAIGYRAIGPRGASPAATRFRSSLIPNPQSLFEHGCSKTC